MAYGNMPETNLNNPELYMKLEYLQGLYPANVKSLHEYVVRACDQMDYQGSPIFDQYPDQLVIDQMVSSICRQIPEGVSKGLEQITDVLSDESSLDEEEVEVYEIMNGQQLHSELGNWGKVHGRPPQGGGPSGRPPHGRPPQGPPPGRPPQGPPPWGPPPGRPPQGPPPWGPPPGRPPQGPPPWGPPPGRPPQGPPPWGPPHGRPPHGRPPHGRPPSGPPPWGPPPRPGGSRWLDDWVKVLLLHEIQRRNCRTGFC